MVPLVTHVVLFTWMAGVTAQQVGAMREALDRMAEELAHLTTIRHGPDLGLRNGNADYALVATYSDKAAWDSYQSHPAHKAFVSDFVTPLLATRVTTQF